MQKEIPATGSSSSSNSGGGTTARLEARYKAHAALERELSAVKALQREIVKAAHYRVAAATLGVGRRNNNNNNTAAAGEAGESVAAGAVMSPTSDTSSTYSPVRSSTFAPALVFDPLQEAAETALRATDGAATCLRLFAGTLPRGTSSRGLSSMDLLYRRDDDAPRATSVPHLISLPGDPDTVLAAPGPVVGGIGRRVRDFVEMCARAQGGVLPPRLAVVAARVLQRHAEYGAAAALLDFTIGAVLDALIATAKQMRQEESGIDATIAALPSAYVPYDSGMSFEEEQEMKRQASEAAAAAAAAAAKEGEGKFQRAILRGAIGAEAFDRAVEQLVSAGEAGAGAGEAQVATAAVAAELSVLLALEVECAAHIGSTSALERLLPCEVKEGSSDSPAAGDEASEQRAAALYALLSPALRHQLTETLKRCRSETAVAEELRRDVEQQKKQRQAYAAPRPAPAHRYGAEPNASVRPSEAAMAADAPNATSSSRTQEGNRPALLARVGAVLQQWLQGTALGAQLPVMVAVLLAVLLAAMFKWGPACLQSVSSWLNRGTASSTRMLTL